MFIKLDKLHQAKKEPDFMQIGNILSLSSHCALHVCCVCVRACVFLPASCAKRCAKLHLHTADRGGHAHTERHLHMAWTTYMSYT